MPLLPAPIRTPLCAPLSFRGAEGADKGAAVAAPCERAVTLSGAWRECESERWDSLQNKTRARDEATLKMDTTAGAHPRRMHNNYEDEEERKHFQRIVSAFRYYKWVYLAMGPGRRRPPLSLILRLFLFLDPDVDGGEDRHDRRRQAPVAFLH